MKVELVTHTPYADLLVVNAARASFGKDSVVVLLENQIQRTVVELTTDMDEETAAKKRAYLEWLRKEKARQWSMGISGDKLTLKYGDYNLINFLAREKHMLPFRHPHITLRCSAPIFVARQLMKHQVGMSWSEESRRYIDSEPEFYWPDEWRRRAENVKQGSSDEVMDKDELEFYIPGAAYFTPEEMVDHMLCLYKQMLDAGVAPEQARMILPQNMMTTWVWTGSLLSWHHMLTLRLDEHTQKETRDFAQMVKDTIIHIAPASMEALLKHGSSTSN